MTSTSQPFQELKKNSETGHLFIWFVAAIHVFWAICLSIDPKVMGITGLHLLGMIFPNRFLLSFVFLFAAGLAVLGTLKKPKDYLQFFYLAPQQFILFLAAASSIHCSLRGSYADGVQHPHWFILADQIPAVLIAIFYSWAIFLVYRSVAVISSGAGERRNG